MSYVDARFKLNQATVDKIQSLKPKFGYNGFGEIVFFRTYSRCDTFQEYWNDVVIRVVEGVFSIRKDWYNKTNIKWDEGFWQTYAYHFAISMFKMEWMPPGRGLQMMGTDFVYERGAMALYNCAFTRITDDIGDDAHWLMDCLMNGVGVGFAPEPNEIKTYKPEAYHKYYKIADSREGWCDSTKLLIDAHLTENSIEYLFDYSGIRDYGEPIKGFGGTASGPQPLIDLHKQIREFFSMYHKHKWYSIVHLKTDIANAIGVCVVAGNVRRSAELACGSITDKNFLDLKDYNKYPYRRAHGWMSNNSAILEDDSDFEKIGEIANRVIERGEPGIINKRNLLLGRIGKSYWVRPDYAIGFNPCGEIPLIHRETCNVAESLPTMCRTYIIWLKACEYATMYMSTVSLLPTHRASTNATIAKNRRIGLSIIDWTGWKHEKGLHKVIKYMREGYLKVRATNKWANSEAGVPEAIRVTTMKPGGTTPKLPGKTSGEKYPNFIWMIRRIRVAQNDPIFKFLHDAGIPHEPDVTQPKYTEVFEYPIKMGPAKPASEISLWEQAMNLVTLQREWADNAVSNTLNFKPKWILCGHFYNSKVSIDSQCFCVDNDDTFQSDCFTSENHKYEIEDNEVKVYKYNPNHEEDDIEQVLASIAPLIKSVSLMPHTAQGVYPQMPEEGITETEYNERLSAIKDIDWSQLSNHEPELEDEKYCAGPTCERLI